MYFVIDLKFSYKEYFFVNTHTPTEPVVTVIELYFDFLSELARIFKIFVIDEEASG